MTTVAQKYAEWRAAQNIVVPELHMGKQGREEQNPMDVEMRKVQRLREYRSRIKKKKKR